MEFIDTKLVALSEELTMKFDKRHKKTQEDMQDIKSNLAKIIDTNGKNDKLSATINALPIRNISKTSFVHNVAINDEVLQELGRKKQHESYLNFPQKKPLVFHIDSNNDNTIEDA